MKAVVTIIVIMIIKFVKFDLNIVIITINFFRNFNFYIYYFLWLDQVVEALKVYYFIKAYILFIHYRQTH